MATGQNAPGFLCFDSTYCYHSFNIQQLIKSIASSLELHPSLMLLKAQLPYLKDNVRLSFHTDQTSSISSRKGKSEVQSGTYPKAQSSKRDPPPPSSFNVMVFKQIQFQKLFLNPSVWLLIFINIINTTDEIRFCYYRLSTGTKRCLPLSRSNCQSRILHDLVNYFRIIKIIIIQIFHLLNNFNFFDYLCFQLYYGSLFHN